MRRRGGHGLDNAHITHLLAAIAVSRWSYHGGPDAVEPGALVVLPRGREGRARQLLRVEA